MKTSIIMIILLIIGCSDERNTTSSQFEIHEIVDVHDPVRWHNILRGKTWALENEDGSYEKYTFSDINNVCIATIKLKNGTTCGPVFRYDMTDTVLKIIGEKQVAVIFVSDANDLYFEGKYENGKMVKFCHK